MFGKRRSLFYGFDAAIPKPRPKVLYQDAGVLSRMIIKIGDK